MNLFVSNISPDTTEDDLRQLFSEFGELVSVKIVYDMATGLPRGFGFVEMADKMEAFDAIDNIDFTYVKGNIINVKKAISKNDNRGKKPSGGGGPKRRFNNNGGGNRDRFSNDRYSNNDRYNNNNNSSNNADRFNSINPPANEKFNNQNDDVDPFNSTSFNSFN